MKAILLREMPVEPKILGDKADSYPPHIEGRNLPIRFRLAPAGTVIETPDAWRLVHIGCAKPGDQECQNKCGLTDAQILVRYQKYDLLDKGQFSGDPKVDVPTT